MTCIFKPQFGIIWFKHRIALFRIKLLSFFPSFLPSFFLSFLFLSFLLSYVLLIPFFLCFAYSFSSTFEPPSFFYSSSLRKEGPSLKDIHVKWEFPCRQTGHHFVSSLKMYWWVWQHRAQTRMKSVNQGIRKPNKCTCDQHFKASFALHCVMRTGGTKPLSDLMFFRPCIVV